MRQTAASSFSTSLFGISGRIRAVFFRQLAAMINSGLPVGRAVATASEAGLGKLGRELGRKVDNGSRLSEAMAGYPNHFSRHEVALVTAGEASGQLDRQLEELAKSAELDWELKKKISGKLLYPILVAHSAILFPPLFLLVKDGLQAYLRAVLSILVPLYLVIGLLTLAYRASRRGGARRALDKAVSVLPILGTPARYGARIRFLHTLANLIEAGFLPSQAVPLAADSCNNYWVKDKVDKAWDSLGKEVAVSEVMRASGAFQSFELGLVVSGEESGSFAQALRKAAQSLRPEYEARVHQLTVILPIVMLFLVGVVVAAVAVKTMTGLFAPLGDIL